MLRCTSAFGDLLGQLLTDVFLCEELDCSTHARGLSHSVLGLASLPCAHLRFSQKNLGLDLYSPFTEQEDEAQRTCFVILNVRARGRSSRFSCPCFTTARSLLL